MQPIFQEPLTERREWESRIQDFCETNPGLCSGYASINITGLAEAIVDAIEGAVKADRIERN